jgi:hypothetical protein
MHSTQDQIIELSPEERVAEAIRRAIPLLPAEARSAVEGLLSPASLAIITATLAVWAGSHFFGIGEIVDIILLVTGFAILGRSGWDLGKELWDFARPAVNAKSERELDEAAGHFARAVTLAMPTETSESPSLRLWKSRSSHCFTSGATPCCRRSWCRSNG